MHFVLSADESRRFRNKCGMFMYASSKPSPQP